MRSRDQRDRRGRVAHHRDVDVERGRLRVRFGCDFADRIEEARPQRAERELVEQHAHLVAVHAPCARSDGPTSSATSRSRSRDLAVEEHAVACLTQVLTLLRRELVEVLVDPFEAAVRGDQLRRRLLADARDARQVVARVAAQRRVVGVLRGA